MNLLCFSGIIEYQEQSKLLRSPFRSSWQLVSNSDYLIEEMKDRVINSQAEKVGSLRGYSAKASGSIVESRIFPTLKMLQSFWVNVIGGMGSKWRLFHTQGYQRFLSQRNQDSVRARIADWIQVMELELSLLWNNPRWPIGDGLDSRSLERWKFFRKILNLGAWIS